MQKTLSRTIISIYLLISYIITTIKMSAFRNLFTKRGVKIFFGTTVFVGIGYADYIYFHRKDVEHSSELKQSEKIMTSIIENTGQKLLTPPIIEEPKQTSTDLPQVTEKIVEKPKEQSLQTHTTEKKQEQKPVSKVKMSYSTFKTMSEITQLSLAEKFIEGDNVLIVADLPFTPDFEAKVVNEINRLRTVFKDLQVYRKDIHVEKVKSQLSKQYKAKIEDQTIFLLKNSNQKQLRHFNFDMFMQYPLLLQVFLTQTVKFQEDQIVALKKRVANLRFNQSCLLYIYDKDEPAQKLKERITTAKYIEMQLVVNNLNNVRILAVEKNAALKSGLVSEQNIRTNSLHLFRKHNIFTPFEPNFNLITEEQQVQPFFRLADIALYESGSSRLMIPAYLSGLQTFDSQEIAAPYICSLRIDRNKISQEEYHNLLKVFGQIKKENKFPEIAFNLKFKQIPYPGKGRPKNSEWQIMLANVEQMEKESMMHQITQPSQLKLLGFSQENFQKERPEYLYEHGVLNKNLLEEFLSKSKKGEVKKYYKSQQKPIASNIKKVTGDGFEKQVLENGKDNIVYEYSDFCPTCKNISPIISHLAQLVQSRGLGLENVQFNRLQANKNRIRNYLYSPYIPNIYYFKRQWKNSPARFPIQFLAGKGVGSIYEFFRINKQIGTISWDSIDRAVSSMQQYEKQLSSL